jgi:hypothetical protein
LEYKMVALLCGFSGFAWDDPRSWLRMVWKSVTKMGR